MARPRLYATRAEKDAAYYQRRKTKLTKLAPLPTGPYRVLYADPPWQYASADPFFHGHARDHYATLSIAELCALPVRKILAPRAVLFLWVTSPILPECWPLLKAWGFTYKTLFVWDKLSANYGYYHNNQHELLLVGTRGACKPDCQALPPSVQRIARGAHSRKPGEFRLLIDALYPEGKRLELFAREQHEGWDAWGREAPEGQP